MAKQLSPEEILQHFLNLSTENQLFVISEGQKILDEKAKKAEAELSLIKNNGK